MIRELGRTAVWLVLGGLGAAFHGAAMGSDWAPYHYGNWIPVGAGHSADTEYVVVNPDDANIVICDSDAVGLSLSCDMGETWCVVNKGLVGGKDDDGDGIADGYTNTAPRGAPAWDPVDSNYVFFYDGSIYEGHLQKGSPGWIEWSFKGRPTLTSGIKWWGPQSVVFDPEPDPDGTGRAQRFYMVCSYGHVFCTQDGGSTVGRVARIPGFVATDDRWPYHAWDQPVLAVYPAAMQGGDPNYRLIMVAGPEEKLYSYGVHYQAILDDPNTYDPNYGFWTTPDPNDDTEWEPNSPPPGGANGIQIWPSAGSPYGVICCDNSHPTSGGVYTRADAAVGPWQKRGDAFDSPNYVLGDLTFHPADPNICYLCTVEGSNQPAYTGVFRTENLWAADPNDTTWEILTILSEPNNYNSIGHMLVGAAPSWGKGLSLSRSDPNVIFHSFNFSGVYRSTDEGTSWDQVYTNAVDTGLWRHRGITTVGGRMVISPTDPNIYCCGAWDFNGCFKTEDGGKSFWKFFCHYGSATNYVPEELTYGPEGYTKPTSWFRQYHTGDPNDGAGEDPCYVWMTAGIDSSCSGLIHATDPNIGWFVTYENPKNCSLVLKTTDGAESLTIVLPDQAHLAFQRRQYTQMTADPCYSTLYLAAGEDGILKSTDGGPNEIGEVWVTCLDPNDANIVDANDYDPNWWSAYDSDYPTGPFFLTVDVADSDANVIYCATGNPQGFDGSDPRGYVYKSTDAGATWSRAATFDANDPGGRIRQLSVHPEDANVVYVSCYSLEVTNGTTVDYGIWKTADGGQTWTQIFPHPADGYAFAYCKCVAVDPTDPNRVYWTNDPLNHTASQMPQPGIYLTEDAGASYKMLGDPNCDDPNDSTFPLCYVVDRYRSLDVHPSTGDLYLGTNGGPFWYPRERELTISVYYDMPGDPNVVYDPNAWQEGTAWGTVYINGEEYDPNTPITSYPFNTNVTLDAVPEPNYFFLRWYGDLPDGVDAGDPQIVVAMDVARHLYASFNDETLCGDSMGFMMSTWLPAMVVGFLVFRIVRSRRRR